MAMLMDLYTHVAFRHYYALSNCPIPPGLIKPNKRMLKYPKRRVLIRPISME